MTPSLMFTDSNDNMERDIEPIRDQANTDLQNPESLFRDDETEADITITRTVPEEEAGQRAFASAEVDLEREAEERFQSFMSSVEGIGTDVGGGLLEAPKQILAGGLDAVRNAAQGLVGGAESLRQALAPSFEQFLADPLASDEEKEAVRQIFEQAETATAEEVQRADRAISEKIIPRLAEAETVTGSLARSASQFLTGFLPALRGARALGAGGSLAQAAGAGALADVAVFDPQQPRVSNLINDLAPELQNPITDFLAAQPGDTEAEGRLKNALEGLALGGIGDAVFQAARALRGTKAARDAFRSLQRPGMTIEPFRLPQKFSKAKVKAGGRELNFASDLDKALYAVGNPRIKASTKEPFMRSLEDYTGLTIPKIQDVADRTFRNIQGQVGRTSGEGAIDVPPQNVFQKRGSDLVEKTPENMPLAPDVPEPGSVARAQDIITTTSDDPRMLNNGEEFLAMADDPQAIKGKPMDINFERVRTEDDVKQVLAKISKIYNDEISKVREPVSMEEVARRAAEEGLTTDQLITRQQFDAINRFQAFRAREINLSSAKRLRELALEAQRSGSVEAKDEFVRQLDLHRQIQVQTASITNEAGSTLRTFGAEAAPGEIDFMKQLDQRIQQVSEEQALGLGADVVPVSSQLPPNSLDEMIDIVADSDTVEELAKMTADIHKPTWTDKLLEYYVNSLLSGPQTHVVNILGNLQTFGNAVAERAIASRIPLLQSGQIVPGEASALLHGAVQSTTEAYQLAWKAFKTGESQFGLTKFDDAVRRRKAIFADPSHPLYPVGELIRLPGRALTASDDFMKTINFRAEINAQSYRMASREGFTPGTKEFQARQRLIAQNPTSEIVNQAQDFAAYQTFTNDLGPGAQAFQDAIASHPAAKLIVPFFRTPTNIFKYNLERIPGFNLLLREVRNDIAAGGARRDMAIAKMGLSSMTIGTLSIMANSGLITGSGPSNRDLRREMEANGWQQNSVLIGNRYVSLSRTDPLGQMVGGVADMTEYMKQSDWSDSLSLDFAAEFTLATALAFKDNFMSKTYMMNLSQMLNAITNPLEDDPSGEIKATGRIRAAGRQFVGSFVPTFFAQANRAFVDPIRRETRERGLPLQANRIWEESLNGMRARVFGYSDDLPPLRSISGKPMTTEGLFAPFDFINPFYTRKVGDDPVLNEVERLRLRIGHAPQYIRGVRLTNEEYDRYVVLSGNELKVGGQGMWERLTQFVKSPEYQDLSDGTFEDPGSKELAIRKIIRAYRDAAKGEMITNEFPELQGLIRAREEQRIEALTPQER